MSREMALAAYRALLRSSRIAFQGDSLTLMAARNEARRNFEGNRTLPPDSEMVAKSIEHAQGVAKVLRENVVQGKESDDGRYQLKIHEHTERGDNESIKKNKGKNTLTGVKCCSA